MDIASMIETMVDELEVDVNSLSPSEQRDLILEVSKKDLNGLDLIWTQTGSGDCCSAVASGWSYGFRSSDDLCYYGKSPGRNKHYPIFIDNLYEDYKHRHHLRIVKKYRPKYCTVRDLMTPQQCEEAGIRYYSPSKILEWAYELKEYAEKVMLIPKHEKYLKFVDSDKFMIEHK